MPIELVLTFVIIALWFLGGWSITGFIEHGNEEKLSYNQGLWVYFIWPFIPVKAFVLGMIER